MTSSVSQQLTNSKCVWLHPSQSSGHEETLSSQPVGLSYSDLHKRLDLCHIDKVEPHREQLALTVSILSSEVKGHNSSNVPGHTAWIGVYSRFRVSLPICISHTAITHMIISLEQWSLISVYCMYTRHFTPDSTAPIL